MKKTITYRCLDRSNISQFRRQISASSASLRRRSRRYVCQRIHFGLVGKSATMPPEV